MAHYHNKRNMISQRRAHVAQYKTRHDWNLPLLPFWIGGEEARTPGLHRAKSGF